MTQTRRDRAGAGAHTGGHQRHSEADKKYFELGINLFDLSQQAPDIFLQTEPERKRKLYLICQEMYTIDGRLVVRFTDLFYTLSQLAEALNRSKQQKSAPSPFKIFELQKSPYFDLQNGAEVPKIMLCSLGGHSSELNQFA